MNPSRTYPDADICKTSLYCEEIYNCLAESAYLCPFAIPFGYGYFCKHPDRADFQHMKP
jgi:hypothetical protein